MSERITVLFTNIHRFHGLTVDGQPEFWCPEENKQYCVTIEHVDNRLIYLTLPNGFRMGFLPPGMSTNYVVVREGWNEIDPPAWIELPSTPIKPKPAILESALILEIEPAKHESIITHTEYLIYKLPRVLNGLLVDRGRVSQEVVVDRANPECVGEIHGVASFMLSSRNNNLRYNCVSFRIDNKTTKKNLTSEHGCASVNPS